MAPPSLTLFLSQNSTGSSSENPESALFRLSQSSLGQTQALTASQTQVKEMVATGFDQMTDWTSLSAMVSGGLCYRLGRVGFLASAGFLNKYGKAAGLLVKTGSYGVGLAEEVVAFELTHRSLHSLHPSPITGHPSPNRWSFFGTGGLWEGLKTSYVHFGALKGMGRLSHGQNLAVQHLLQSSGMVVGHQITGRLGWTPMPEGDLVEQLFHSEITNLQISAGMGLVHFLFPRVAQIERGLEQSLQLQMKTLPKKKNRSFAPPEPLLAAEGPSISLSETFSESKEKESGAMLSLGSGSSSGALLTREQLKTFCGEAYEKWASFLTAEAGQAMSELEKTFVIQDGMNLIHRYASALHAGIGGEGARPFHEIPLQPDLLREALRDLEYSPRSLELFDRFYREVLGQKELPPLEEILAEKHLEMIPPSSSAPPSTFSSKPPSSRRVIPFIAPETGDTWATYLSERLNVTYEELNAAELPVKGTTIFQWGTSRNAKGRLCPPGDILHLLGVIEYLNTKRGSEGVDPFEAIRLTMPEQLKDFQPDENGNIVIRYPELMKDLDYSHFNLQSFLKLYLAARDQAEDVDLARQWGVSSNTVQRYRTGTQKMHLETLEKLIDGIVSGEAGKEKKIEMRNFLMFLRYRSYFEKTMDLVHNDQNLSQEKASSSEYGIFLVAHEKSLRDLDLTRRIQFEKEPFASAIDGSVDVALSLLGARQAEFALAGDERVDLVQKVEDFKKGHGDHLTILSQQKKSPGIVQPGKIREIQNFYRQFFRYFETIHLHTRPEGELSLGLTTIHFDIVPPTAEHSRGVKIEAEPQNPNRLNAYVVAADLVELRFADHPLETLHEVLKLRIVWAVLREMNVLLPGDEISAVNQRILKNSFERMGLTAPSAESFELFYDLEKKAAEGNPTAVDYLREAILHRIVRGRSQEIMAERRRFQWEGDLQKYIEREGVDPGLAHALQNAFKEYAEKVPHPFKRFNEVVFEKAVELISSDLPPTPSFVRRGGLEGSPSLYKGEGRGEVELGTREIQHHLIAFMKSIGLPTEVPKANGKLIPSSESLAQSAFAGYVEWFSKQHPLRLHQRIVADETLVERMIEERLVDFPELGGRREAIKEHLLRLIEDYNQRPHPLRIHELPGSETAGEEPFQHRPLEWIYQFTYKKFTTEHPASDHNLSGRLFYVSLRNLRELLSEGLKPSELELNNAYTLALKRLAAVGESQNHLDRTVFLDFLGQGVSEIHQHLQGVERLSSLVSSFVGSKNYQSGLEKNSKLAQNMQSIFRLHAASALLDMRPMPLNDAIFQVVGERFGPYGKIREDVVRDLRVIHQEALAHLRQRYQVMEEAWGEALKEARKHKNEDSFWGDFQLLVSLVDSGVQDRSSLEKRIEDLENFLGLMHHRPNLDLSGKIKEGIKEIEALKNQSALSAEAIEAVLKAEIPAEILEKYSEFYVLDHNDLKKQIEKLEKAERSDLVRPEARPLLQLLALLNAYGEKLSGAGREAFQEIELEVVTSAGEKPLEKVTEEAFRAYEAVRDSFLSQMDPLVRVGALPEVRLSGPRLVGDEAGRALQFFITQRFLPPGLNFKLFALVDEAIQRVHRNPDAPDEFGAVYWSKLAEFHLKNRKKINESEIIEVSEEDLRPLNIAEPPAAQREKLEKEAPEVWLLEDREHFQSLLTSHGDQGEVSKGDYLRIKIEGLIAQSLLGGAPLLASLIKVRESFEWYLARWVMMVHVGASAPHLKTTMTAQHWDLYQAHRPAILAHLIETVGVERLAAVLPELREAKLEQPDSEKVPIKSPYFPDWQGVAKMAELLRKGLPEPEAKQFEKLLWDLVPSHFDLEDVSIGNSLRLIVARIVQFYFKNRNKLNLTAFTSGLTLEEVESRLAAETSEYWELQIFPKEEIKEFQSADERPPFIENWLRPTFHGRVNEKSADMLSLNYWHLEQRIPYPMIQMMGVMNRGLSLPQANSLKEIFKQDSYRVEGFTFLGINPYFALEMWGKRVLERYEKERRQLIDQIDFTEDVVGLPEVQAIPETEVEKIIVKNYGPTSLGGKGFSAEGAESVFFRLVVLFEYNKAVEFKRLARELNKKTKGIDKIAMLNKIAARFYLEHRSEIRPFLKPWPAESAPEASREAAVVTAPSQTSVPPASVLDQVFEFPELADLKEKTKIENGFLYTRILHLILEAKNPDLEKAFTAAIQPATTEDMHLWAADFYVKNREEILAAKREAEEGMPPPMVLSQAVKDLVEEFSNFPEIQAISKEKGWEPDVWLETPASKIYFSLEYLTEQPWFPPSLKGKFRDLFKEPSIVLLHPKKTDMEDFLRKTAKFYKAHRDEILAARK